MKLPFSRTFSLVPKTDRFFFLLHQSATNIQQVARRMESLMEDFNNVDGKIAEIRELEQFGDQIIHNITRSLHRTFITPIDREDILELASSLDDVIDAVDEAAQYILAYKIKQPTQYACDLSKVIVGCADQLERALGLLATRGSKLEDILPMAVEINRLENEADQILNLAMGDLFSNGTDVKDILKWRDIYSDLEEATDRAEDAANVLEGIVVKHS